MRGGVNAPKFDLNVVAAVSGNIGDDVETVKNSMINLLNVVIEGGVLDEESKNQGQPPRRLVEVSQEAIQKMHAAGS